MRNLFIAIFCFCTLPIFAQLSGADSIRSTYFASNANTLPIYNGRGFLNPYAAIKGSAFLGTVDWVDGSIEFDNVWYTHIPILFDVYKDELIVKHPSGNALVLFKDRVQAFSFNSMHFVQLALDAKKEKPEFYEVLAAGELTILARRSRILDERIVDNVWDRRFQNHYTYYALKDGVATSFVKSKQLLKIAKKDGKNIVPDLKKSKIKFKSTPEPYMIRVAELYNQ